MFGNNYHDLKYSIKIFNIITNANMSLLKWEWRNSLGRISVDSNPDQNNKKKWKFIYFLAVSHLLFQIIGFCLYFNTYLTTNAVDDYLVHLIWVAGIGIGTASFTHTVIYQKDIPILLNQMFELNRKLKFIFGENSFKRSLKIVDIFVTDFALKCLGAFFVLILLNLIYPDKKRYITSTLPCINSVLGETSCKVFCCFVIIIFAMLDTFLTSLAWILGGLQFFINLTYLEVTRRALILLLIAKPTMNIHQQHKLYQSLRTLHQFYNQVFGEFMYPMAKLAFGTLQVCSLYTTLELLRSGQGSILTFSISMLITIVAIIMQFLIYTKAGQIAKLATKTSKYVCYHSKSCVGNNSGLLYGLDKKLELYKLKHYRSFGPIKIHVGIFYDVKTVTYLTFLHQIIQVTLPLLMLTK